jgi:hypothetical protein
VEPPAVRPRSSVPICRACFKISLEIRCVPCGRVFTVNPQNPNQALEKHVSDQHSGVPVVLVDSPDFAPCYTAHAKPTRSRVGCQRSQFCRVLRLPPSEMAEHDSVYHGRRFACPDCDLRLSFTIPFFLRYCLSSSASLTLKIAPARIPSSL